jgi:hypothetical protein
MGPWWLPQCTHCTKDYSMIVEYVEPDDIPQHVCKLTN